MANERSSNDDRDSLLSELGRQAAQMSSTALGLPRRIEESLEKLEQGDLRLRVRSTESDRILRRLSSVNMGTNYALLTGAFTLAATLLFVNQYVWLAGIMALLAVAPAIAFIRLLLRLNRFERMP